MCGITGMIDFKRNLNKEINTLTKMTTTLEKRGPDETNVWIEGHAGFGHKRLIVVDPEGGRQPMRKTGKGASYTICYNGELYNTEDIRKELLSKGYSFAGHSDTEVLLTAYIEWGEDCVYHLNGIFAFAVWDEKNEKLFISRDRLGVKPLFYREFSGGILFGSELKAILAHPSIKAELDREGLADIFGLGPSRTPGTGVFKGCKELKPAHSLIFTRNGLTLWRYWNVESSKHTDSVDETIEKVRYLVSDAVTRQLVSDVPLATFLSGGVDSSIISAIAAQQFATTGKGNLHTYSIDYEDNHLYFQKNEFQPDDDSRYIQLMANEFSTNHSSIVINQEQLAANLAEAVVVRDFPGMADIDSSLLWFCREIKKDFVVSLSGECADEIFGGYPWFHRPDDLARDGFPWMRSVTERQNLLKSNWREKLHLNEHVMEKYMASVAEAPKLDGETPEEAKRREIFYLNMIWFMTTLLDRKDRMSMGAGLEVRVPFSDHRIVEYAWNIPWDMKMYGGREKGILRKAFEGILPEDVLYRKKSPYPKTHNPHYTKLVQNLLSESLAKKSSVLHEFFDDSQLKDILASGGTAFKQPWFGQLMTGPQLLAHLYQIHIWFEEYGINVVE